MSYKIGFDLGGTKMIAGVIDSENKIIAREKKKSGSQQGPDEVLKRIMETIKGVIKKAGLNPEQISSLGIAVPGVIDLKAGVVKQAPNLGMRDFPLTEPLEREFPFPVILENDVNAGVYGEFIAGAAKGYDHVLGVFPGTGIGGGLILGGHLYRGATGSAGEFGHMIIQNKGPLCGCGQEGCVEALASRTAMAKDAAALSASGKLPPKLSKYGSEIKSFKSSFFKEAWDMKNPEVNHIIERSAYYLGVAIANTVNLLNPELILLGGGVMEKLGEPYLKMIEKQTREHAMAYPASKLEFVLAQLGDDAVLFGAANL